jgi:hypothetical protein
MISLTILDLVPYIMSLSNELGIFIIYRPTPLGFSLKV